MIWQGVVKVVEIRSCLPIPLAPSPFTLRVPSAGTLRGPPGKGEKNNPPLPFVERPTGMLREVGCGISESDFNNAVNDMESALDNNRTIIL